MTIIQHQTETSFILEIALLAQKSIHDGSKEKCIDLQSGGVKLFQE